MAGWGKNKLWVYRAVRSMYFVLKVLHSTGWFLMSDGSMPLCIMGFSDRDSKILNNPRRNSEGRGRIIII